MSISSSGKKLEGFFTGKGFYIVLFLCAAVIGLSAWMMAAGNETMDDLNNIGSMSFEPSKVETVIIPPQSTTEDIAPVMAPEVEVTAPVIAGEAVEVWSNESAAEAEASVYIWPVLGELDRGHDLEHLSYDVTLNDWRTHDGVDIAAPLGTNVAASCAGTVLSIEEDSLYGTVVSIEHGEGMLSVYANLDEFTTVSAGDWVEAGDIIGSIGDTALCEVAQNSHLHFAMQCSGESVDPMDYLG